MNAYEACQKSVVTVRGQEELATAAWMMRERNVGCLVVVEPAGTGGWSAVGLITDRDIVTNVIARDCDPRTVVTEDVMSRAVTVWSNSLIEDVLIRMRESGVRRMVVIDQSQRMVGILSRDDIFEHLSQRVDLEQTGNTRMPSTGQNGYRQNLDATARSRHA